MFDMNFFKLSLFFTLFFLPTYLIAQNVDSTTVLLPADTAWDKGGDISINFSQISLSNWAGGGQSSIALSTILNFHADYDKGRNLWNNKFQAAYGLIRQGDGEGIPIRKSDDLFLLESQYGRRFSNCWLASFLVNFRSQFYKGEELKKAADGSDSTILVSEFMSPAYVQAALGFTYKKTEVFIFTLSPITSKNTIVFNDRLAPIYGVKENKNIRSEVGASFNANLKKEIFKNVRFETNLNLFSNYQKAQNVDVNWTTHIVLKVNKYINSSITTQLIYDDDIDVPRDDKATAGPATQFKSAINVGFSFVFGKAS